MNEGLSLILRLNVREDLFSGRLKKKCFHQGERKTGTDLTDFITNIYIKNALETFFMRPLLHADVQVSRQTVRCDGNRTGRSLKPPRVSDSALTAFTHYQKCSCQTLCFISREKNTLIEAHPEENRHHLPAVLQPDF